MVLLLPVLAVLVVAAPAQAQDLPVMARLVFDGAPLTVGTPAHFTLEVIHPVDTVAILPVLDAEWSPVVEVQKQSAPVTRDNGDGTLTTSQKIDAALFAPGSFTTPPVRAVVSDRAGVTVSAVAAPMPIAVNSVLTPEDVAPRDIKPQATLSWLWIATGWIARCAASAAAAGVADTPLCATAARAGQPQQRSSVCSMNWQPSTSRTSRSRGSTRRCTWP